MISGRTKICDIDMLLIARTSSLFNNVMHNDIVTTPLGKYNFTLGLGICCHTTDGIGIKKRQLLVLCGSTRSYICAC